MNVNNERKNIFAYMITTNNNYGGANVNSYHFKLGQVFCWIKKKTHPNQPNPSLTNSTIIVTYKSFPRKNMEEETENDLNLPSNTFK